MTLLRSAAFNAWFFGLTALLALAGLAVRWWAPHRALDLAKLWARLVLAGLRAICRIQIVVTGREHLPAHGPALIASQHQSAFDTVVWFLLVPRPAYVHKAELARIPLFGPLLAPAGQIGVDRNGGTQAMRALLRSTVQAAAECRQIVIFPEGTRTQPGEHTRLQPGVAAVASRTGLPVIPVATDSGLRWKRRGFRKAAGTIHVAIGAPLAPTTRSADLLAALRAYWDSAAATRHPCG